MPWQHEYSVVVPDVTKEQIWQVWKDVNNWHQWDPDIEFARMNAPFETGGTFMLKPKGGPRVKLELASVEPLRSYTDFTRFPLAQMYGIHEMRDTDRGLEIRCRIRVQGPLTLLWRKLVAEGVARGLEEQTRKMVEYAKAREHHGRN
jgi:hypothetical protein